MFSFFSIQKVSKYLVWQIGEISWCHDLGSWGAKIEWIERHRLILFTAANGSWDRKDARLKGLKASQKSKPQPQPSRIEARVTLAHGSVEKKATSIPFFKAWSGVVGGCWPCCPEVSGSKLTAANGSWTGRTLGSKDWRLLRKASLSLPSRIEARVTLAHRSVEKKATSIPFFRALPCKGCHGGVVGACWPCYPEVSGSKLTAANGNWTGRMLGSKPKDWRLLRKASLSLQSRIEARVTLVNIQALVHKRVEKKATSIPFFRALPCKGCHGGLAGAYWPCYSEVSGSKLTNSKQKLDRKDPRLKGLIDEQNWGSSGHSIEL